MTDDSLIIGPIFYELGPAAGQTAAIEDLKNLTIYCDLRKVIEQKKYEFQLLEMAVEDKKAAVATVATLRKSGIYEREILEVAETIKKNNGHGRPESDMDMDLPEQPENLVYS